MSFTSAGLTSFFVSCTSRESGLSEGLHGKWDSIEGSAGPLGVVVTMVKYGDRALLSWVCARDSP